MTPDRIACLRDLDLVAFRILIGHQELTDAATMLAIHKARTVAVFLDASLRLESVEWLRARGYSGYMGLELPAPGELPG